MARTPDDPRATAKRVFARAVELSGEARQTYLQRACAGDPELAAEVESLIEHGERAPASFLQPEVELPPPDDPPLPDEQIGARVGPFEILGVLGRGGMGVVYRARQRQPVEREVALKVVHPGLDSRRVLERFRAEQRALSLMDHPNVARVLDAGVTGTGRPYFVMELVAGEPITSFCKRHALGTRAMLQLFQTVCRGVQHAHSKGVIHRDLKPRNILVGVQDGQAVAKVIDFGVAKATGNSTADAPGLTHPGELIGTLGYMSPEQVEGASRSVDTRSDVYSLGVVLYELLTGQLPFADAAADLAALRRAMAVGAPPRPSSLIATGAGELDWIVLQALDRDPARRYQMAHDFADDIGRYLRNEPIAARPPTRAYLLRKFVARNLGLVFSVAAVALALVVGSGLAVYGLLEARHDRDAMRRALDEADTLVGFLEDMLASAHGDRPGHDPTVREFLESAEALIPTRLVGRPCAEARLRLSLGVAFLGIGMPERAEVQLRRALELRRQEHGRDHADTLPVLHTLGQALRIQHQDQPALEVAREVLRLRRLLPDTEISDLIEAIVAVAMLEMGTGAFEAARDHFIEAYDLARARLGENHTRTLAALSYLGELHFRQKHWDEAAAAAEEVLRRGRASGQSSLRAVLAIGNLARVRVAQGRGEDALVLLDEAAQLAEREFPADHWLRGMVHGRRGQALLALDRADDAEPELLRAHQILAKTPGVADEFSHGVASDLAALYAARGDTAAAAAWRARAR